MTSMLPGVLPGAATRPVSGASGMRCEFGFPVGRREYVPMTGDGHAETRMGEGGSVVVAVGHLIAGVVLMALGALLVVGLVVIVLLAVSHGRL